MKLERMDDFFAARIDGCDAPLTADHETDVLRRAGFGDVRIMKRWGESTYTVLARKD